VGRSVGPAISSEQVRARLDAARHVFDAIDVFVSVYNFGSRTTPLTDEQLRKEADAIRTIGAASFVLSSDLGQPQNPLHTDGLLALYKGLMAQGISAADIDAMSRENPARLLGLQP